MRFKTFILILTSLSLILTLPKHLSSQSNPSQKIKIYISADMEGIGGVVHGDFTSIHGKEYQRARKWMTQEVNAAIEGALAAGATEILVNDSHGSMRNILIEDLNPAAKLITGSPKPLSMMEGIDNTFDAVISSATMQEWELKKGSWITLTRVGLSAVSGSMGKH